jgi:hypothetical protein
VLAGVWVACTTHYLRQPIAGPQDYVQATNRSIARGDLAAANDLLQRALDRFPDDPHVRLWKVRLDYMQWREQEALEGLQQLGRSRGALVLNHQELMGRIGDVLFQMGRYWESIDYLVAGSVGERKRARNARAKLAPRLPYTRRHVAITTVEMPLVEGELPEMVCRFGDKDRSLVLDTGASVTIVTKSMGEELGVTELLDQGLVQDATGRTFAAWLGVLPAFTLGEVDLGPQPVLVVEDERLAMRSPLGGPKHPPTGVVGLDVLSRFRTTFDPDRKSVVFESPRQVPDEHAVLLVLNSGWLQLPVLVEGVKMWFILDTGASHTSLTDRGLRLLPGGNARAMIDHRYDHTVGGTTVLVRKVPDLTIQVSAVLFPNATLPVVERPQSGFPVHGVLGADLLMRCRVTIDRGWLTVSRRATRKQDKD